MAHLTGYGTNPDVQQFVTIGKQGYDIHLFSSDLNAVGANPNLIADINALQRQTDNTAVPAGSVKLLTQVDNFGPPIVLLGEFEGLTHDDMLYNCLDVMGPVWMTTLLALPTTLHLTGLLIEPIKH
ncbi:MAG: hypothetical protein ACUVSZ_15860 [Chloroflexus sp.]|uniref:hypothetical protein n=1 Tax=Chloroflexus sp. TaxID=1904827 RepID=UPI004049F734